MAKVLGGPRSCDGHETDGDHGLGCATAQDAHRIRSGSPNSPSSAFDDQRPRDSNGRKDGIEPQLRLAPSLSPQAAAPASKAQQRFTPGPVHGEVNALNSQPPGTPAAVTPRLPPDMLLAEASRPQRRPPPATIHPSHPTPDIHPFPYTPAAPPERLGSRAADVAQHAPAHIVSRFGQLLKQYKIAFRQVLGALGSAVRDFNGGEADDGFGLGRGDAPDARCSWYRSNSSRSTAASNSPPTRMHAARSSLLRP
ncbi:hypothetical protein V8E36_006337 [Tilletia maclaganii]